MSILAVHSLSYPSISHLLELQRHRFTMTCSEPDWDLCSLVFAESSSSVPTYPPFPVAGAEMAACFYFHHQCMLALSLVYSITWRCFSLRLRSAICPSLFCKCNISGWPQGNLVKIGTNVHLASKKNWLDFGGLGSKARITDLERI